MTHTFKLARRAARFRVPVLATLLALAFGACNTDELTNTSTQDLSTPATLGDPAAVPVGAIETPSFATAFRGGIPFGTSSQPNALFGDTYNGALRGDWPAYLLDNLRAIKALGGKVVVSFAGNERHFKTDGYFDLSKWKSRINRYRNVNFSSYIQDGTIVGHYLIDEPNDPHNWNGKPVPPSVLEEMARYSKQLWPGMVTIVRAEPSYLGNNHRYLDAAWAQYVYRKGSASDYIRRNVSAAQNKGLALVVGMNLIKGGPNGRKMYASEVKTWGSTLLGSSYPCAFISWQYNSDYLQTTAMKDAMRTLRGKAQNRSTKTCRG